MQSLENNDFKNALNEREGFHVWWRLLRPHTLTASFIPVFVGTMFAVLDQPIHFLLFIAMLLASMLIQAATNMFNEYYDFKRGLDNDQSVGIGGTIVRDGVAPKTVLTLAFSFFGLAMLLGVYICLETNWWLALVGIICMLSGYLYTGGPMPIAYTPFGELFAGFFMGAMIIVISYFIQTNEIPTEVWLISIPVSIFIGTILLSNNIRDLEGDKLNGRKTLAIMFGHENAVRFLAISFIISYVITLILILIGLLPVWALLSFLSGKKAIDAVQAFRGKKTNIEMMPGMKATAQTNTLYGFLLGISLLVHLFIPFSF